MCMLALHSMRRLDYSDNLHFWQSDPWVTLHKLVSRFAEGSDKATQ